MKNYLESVLFLIGLLIVTSCNQEAENLKINDEIVTLSLVTDASVIQNIKSSVVTMNGRMEDSYNWNSVSIVKLNGLEVANDAVMYVIPALNDDSERLGVYQKPNGEMSSIKVKVNQKSENIVEIQYYSVNDELMASVTADSNTNEFKVIKAETINGRINDCGQATADCIEEIYTDWGWWSVAAVIGSIANPGVGAGIVGLCMLEMCVGDGQV